MSQFTHSDIGALVRRQELLVAALRRMESCHEPLERAGMEITRALQHGGRVLVAGNGGSAAQAAHFAAELIGRFMCERGPLPAIALTADSAVLTALGNDYGYAEVFARQVAGLGRAGDVLVVLSTSGNSENIVRAAETGTSLGIPVIGLTGEAPSHLSERATIVVRAPAHETSTVQELHLVMLHFLAGMAEQHLTQPKEMEAALR